LYAFENWYLTLREESERIGGNVLIRIPEVIGSTSGQGIGYPNFHDFLRPSKQVLG
jgi:hypothetical protein